MRAKWATASRPPSMRVRIRTSSSWRARMRWPSRGLDAAIERAASYVEAGADMIFAEAMTELTHYKKFKAAVNVPLLANMTEFGRTPLYSKEELGAAGVDMILYPLSALRAMNKAALNVYEAIRRDGHQKAVVATMQTREELYGFLDYHAYERQARRTVRGEGMTAAAAKPKVKTGGLAGCERGRYRHLRRRRQPRFGLSRLQHLRPRRARDVRGSRLPASLRHAAEREELASYRAKLKAQRDLPAALKEVLERIPHTAHPMDVMRTATSFLGTIEPEAKAHDAFAVTDRLLAVLPAGAGLLVEIRAWENTHRLHYGGGFHRRTFPDAAARQTALGAARAGDGRLAHPLCRARIQRFDLRRARCHLDAVGLLFGDHRRPSARCAGRCTAAPTRRRWSSSRNSKRRRKPSPA